MIRKHGWWYVHWCWKVKGRLRDGVNVSGWCISGSGTDKMELAFGGSSIPSIIDALVIE
jgi:hypothetical protein